MQAAPGAKAPAPLPFDPYLHATHAKSLGISPPEAVFCSDSCKSDLNMTAQSGDHFAGIDDVRQQMSCSSTGVRAGTNAMLQRSRGVGILRE
jgi:hypothetical protein